MSSENGFKRQLNSDVTVGVDVGGTTVTAMVVDHHLNALSQVTQLTNITSPTATIDGIVTTILDALNEAHVAIDQVTAVGLGIPGQVDQLTGNVQLAVNLNWANMPAGSVLTEQLGIPCFLENDVRLAALGAHHFLADSAPLNIAYVSIGTGIAAGLILEGSLYRGTHGMSGEIGHIVIEPDGPRCNCGNRGCLELYTAGPAIVKAGEEAMANKTLALPDETTKVTAVAIFDAAKQGNKAAKAIIDNVGYYIGRGLQLLLMAYDVDFILLGGGIARSGNILRQAILQEWQRQADLSPLAKNILNPGKLQFVPSDQNAGTWGGVVLARKNMANHQLDTAVIT